MKNKNKNLSIFTISVILLTQVFVFIPQAPVSALSCDQAWCGNGLCDSTCGESNSNCSTDCQSTGGTNQCSQAWCGNGLCDSSCGESTSNCSTDCKSGSSTTTAQCSQAWCGNGLCDSTCGETTSNCSTDCKTGSGGTAGCSQAWCGNGLCDSTCGETTSNCSTDCKTGTGGTAGCSQAWCGNGLCDSTCGETTSNCSTDCKTADPCSQEWCGNGICNSSCGESSLNCSTDCVTEINDAVSGSLTVSSNAVCVGKNIAITLAGQDDDGMVELKLMIDNAQGARENTLVHNCSSATQCSQTWDIVKNVEGKYKLTAKFFGQRPDGTPEVYSIDDRYIEYKACPAPSVDIKANNSDGPITIPYNTSANLSWTSQNADSCTASLDWSGTKNLTGSESTGNLTSSKIYKITCTGAGGTANDSVTVNVSSAPTPTVSITANGNDGQTTILYNTSATLAWTSQNSVSCLASGDWSGSKSISGSESTGNLISSKNYTITCTGIAGGTVSDSVNVNVSLNHPPIADAGPDKEIFETESVILEGSGSDSDGDNITYRWSCNGGVLSDLNAPRPIYFAPIVTSDVTYTCTLTVTDSRGASASDSANIKVKEHHCLDLSVSLLANPNNGCAPLNGVDLTAGVSGTASGTVIYFFDCQNDGVWERSETRNESSFTVSDICNYSTAGNYIAKVRVQREGLSAENTTQINVQTCSVPSVDLKANGFDGSITITNNTSATLSWTSNNVTSCTASGNWSGNKSVSGSESTGNLTSSKTYTITCIGSGGTVSDSVTINVSGQAGNLPPIASAGPDRDVVENSSITILGSGFDPDGGSVTYFWSCSAGTISPFNIAQPVYFAPSVSQSTYYTCTLVVTDNQGLSASDQMNVLVNDQFVSTPAPSFSAFLSANPSSGCMPLNGVDLTASIFGNFSGTFVNNYSFDCTNDGIWDRILSSTDNTFTVFDACNYAFAGTYTARVRVERQGQVAENTTQINVTSCAPGAQVSINKTVRNLSIGGAFFDSILASPGDVLTFSIAVGAGSLSAQNVIVRDIMPSNITWRIASLKVDGVLTGGDIISGLNLGTLSAFQARTITFDADIAGPANFSFGNTQLVNTATVSGTNISGSDTAQITVNKASVAGAATGVSTGFSGASIIIPLLIALALVFILKSHILKVEEWLDKRKKQFDVYKTNKKLRMKIAKTRVQEILTRRI